MCTKESNPGSIVCVRSRCSQGTVIKKVSDPILGRPPDLSRPPTPQIFPSKKPLVAAHTPRPPAQEEKNRGKNLSRHFQNTRAAPYSPYMPNHPHQTTMAELLLYSGLLCHNNINIAVLLSIKTCGYIITYVASMFALREISVGCYFSTIYTHT